MRLLILTPEFEERGGGIATYYRTLAPALRAEGIAVRVIEGSAFHAGAPSQRTVDGIQVETLCRDRLDSWSDRFSAYASAPSLRRHLAAAWAMWEQALGGQPFDIVEATDWGLLFVPPLLERAAPLVVQGHGSVGQIARHDPVLGEETQDLLLRALESATLGCAPSIQTLSRANAAFWRAETGAEVEMIRPAWRPGSPTPSATSNRGLVVGRIQRWKGPDVLCEAVARLGARAPDIDWIGRDTAGGRVGGSTAGELARRHPTTWGPRVRPQPPLPPHRIAEQQSAALFNLVPSSWDVFNFTAAEAMASGRPTIVSTGAGASELISDGENGFLFQADDAESLAACLDRVLSAPTASLEAVARAARDSVERELAPERIAPLRAAAFEAEMSRFNRTAPLPPSWLNEICRPSSRGHDGLAMLDSFGLAPIGRYFARRVARRFAERLGGRAPQ